MESGQKRVVRRFKSHIFLVYEEAKRPDHIEPCDDPIVQGFAAYAHESLEPYLPPSWLPPWYPLTARRYLLTWTFGLGSHINDMTRRTGLLTDELLLRADPTMIDCMNEWIQGRWGYRPALRDLLWRLEVGPRCVTAALWLYDRAIEGEGPRF